MQKLLNYSKKIFQLDGLYIANVSATFLSQFFSALSVLILTPRLLTALGPDQFSLYGVILNAIVVGAILDFGMNLGLLRRFILEKEKSTELFSSVLLAYVFIVIIAGSLSFLATTIFPSLAQGLNSSYLLALIILIFQTIVANLLDVMIQSSQKIFKGKLIRLSKVIAEMLLILYFLQYGSLLWVLIVMLVINTLYIVTLYLYARKALTFSFNLNFAKWQTVREHLKYSTWYFLTALSAVLVLNSQVFLLNKLVGAILLAQFLVYARFFEIIRLAVSNFTVVLFPTIVSKESERDGKKLLHFYFSALGRVFIVLIAIATGLYFIGEPLFNWWMKDKVVFDSTIFFLFLGFTSLILIDNVSALFLSALKLNRMPTIVSLVQGVVGLALTWQLGQFGIFGALIASITTLVFTSFLYNPFYLIKNLRARA